MGEKPLYFLHIPKTAGTSVRAILDRYYSVSQILDAQLWWEVGLVSEVREQNYQFIRGHFGSGANLLSTRPLNTVTMLRDPIKLAHSVYQYTRKEPNTKRHDYVIDNDMSFEDFLTDRKTQHLASNKMVKNFVFGLNACDLDHDTRINQDTFQQFRWGANTSKRKLNLEDRLQLAKQKLIECAWFGLTDRFDESLLLLCYQMAWPPVGKTQKMNVSDPIPSQSQEVLALVESINRLDTELYEFALEQYEIRKQQIFAEMGLSFDCDLEVLAQQVDQHYQKNHLLRRQLKPESSINYDFSQPLLGQNWHEREWNPRRQSYFRWTGPEGRSSIDFWVQKNSHEVVIRVDDVLDEDWLSVLKVFVNGNPMDVEWVKKSTSWEIRFAVLNNVMDDSGLLRVELEVCVAAHSEKFNSGDPRLVGLAISQVMIKPLH